MRRCDLVHLGRAQQIFRVAVYHFAVTGETVGGFDPRLLQAAFVAR